jgi:hypothetical protein
VLNRLGARLPLAALRSTAQVFLGRACPLLGIFMAGVLVARNVGPSSYGVYAGAFALASFTVGGATAGLPILVLRRTSEGDLNRHTLRQATILEAQWLIVMMIISSVVGYIVFGTADGALAAFAAGSYFGATNIANIGMHVHCGLRQFRRAAMADVVAGALFPLLTAVALALGAGIHGSLFALTVASAASWAVSWWYAALVSWR